MRGCTPLLASCAQKCALLASLAAPIAAQVGAGAPYPRPVGAHEVVIERSVMGHPFTVSAFFKFEQLESSDGKITKYVHRHGGPYHPSLSMPLRGGRFGQLVVPQGFLILIWPSMEALGKVYETELKLCGEEMARVKFEKGKVTLDPRPGGQSAGLPGGL